MYVLYIVGVLNRYKVIYMYVLYIVGGGGGGVDSVRGVIDGMFCIFLGCLIGTR